MLADSRSRLESTAETRLTNLGASTHVLSPVANYHQAAKSILKTTATGGVVGEQKEQKRDEQPFISNLVPSVASVSQENKADVLCTVSRHHNSEVGISS